MVATHQLASTLVARELGEVNVGEHPDGRVEVTFTILMTPSGTDAEGWQTGVALDASASMKGWYGKELIGKIPADVQAQYEQRGWFKTSIKDGRKKTVLLKEASDDALQQGHLRLSDNVVEAKSREFISYLASELDADGGTTVIYWACGPAGASIEELGDFTADQCRSLALHGPKSVSFGDGTQLLPAVQYFTERFHDAARGMYVFLTDGCLDDLDHVKQYSRELARRIADGERNAVKFVLVGIGNQIDERQMEELDDLDTGTDVDLWDHKVAAEMRSVVEIFAEVVRENQIVANSAILYDAQQNVIRRFSDGLPAKVSAIFPAGTAGFVLDVDGLQIRQPLK